MLKPVFIQLLVFTLIEAQIFAWLLFSGNWFFTGLVGFMLYRNVVAAYQSEKIAKENGLI